MKKILTALILLTFCTVQMTWAGDVIIIGSDGQPRYEDESKNTSVTKEDIEKAKKKDILNEVTITDETGKRENIYINGRGKVKKVEEEQITKNLLPVDKAKIAEHQMYIERKVPMTLTDIGYILSQYGYKKNDISKKTKKEYLKMNLLDGDYVIGFKDAQYIAEYHEDGSLMGLVKVIKFDFSENKGTVIFYEYRLGYNSIDNDTMGLKHVLFLEFEKDKYISQYIYKHDGTLLCSQVNNNIYLASEARNMLPDWSKRIIIKTIKKERKTNAIKEWHDNNMFHDKDPWFGNTATGLCLLSAYGGATFFIIPPIILTIFVVSELICLPFCINVNKTYKVELYP